MKKIFVVLCGAMLFVGCGDDGVTAPPSTTTLTQEQADALANSIGLGISSIPSGSSKLAARLLTQSFGPETENCEVSGSRSISGSVSTTGNSSSGTASFSATETVSTCTEKVNATDEITTNGSITFSGTASGNQTSASVNAKIVGSLDVSGTNITAGTCGIGVVITASGTSNGSGTLSISGSICGKTISVSGSF